MVQKYIIDKADIHNLLTGKEIPLEQGNKARAFCVEIAGRMTNGEVIQALFPNMTIAHKSSNGVLIVVENLDAPYPHEFYTEWWDAPYKAESEDKAE